jgi:cell division protease FtsH
MVNRHPESDPPDETEPTKKADESPFRTILRSNLTWVVVAVLGLFLLKDFWTKTQAPDVIPYSEFQTLLAEGKVEEVSVAPDRIQGTLKSENGAARRFTTIPVENDLAKQLGDRGVKFTAQPESDVLPMLLSWVLPLVLFAGIWMFLLRRMGSGGPGGGLMAIGKSKAKIFVETDVKVTFADVAGVDEAKSELQEIVAFLKDPTGYGRLGARMPKGVLLVGPPGTGKTLLARAVAGEASVPFFSISGSEFVEMFVGVGAARVRDLFEQARQKAPCIIFVDELDALGRARGASPMMGSHDEKEQTLNQLLVELDGFDAGSRIVLIGATNRPEILDPALLRAGRFDRQVLVDRPDRIGRAQILRVHMKKITLSEDISPEAVASLTPGFTGADLANLVNEAALAATRRSGALSVAMEDFTMAIERIVAGLEKKNRLINPKEREVVAYHEMGHAVVAAALPGADPVHKISIVPRGVGALGYTIQRPTDDRYLMTKEELENKISVLLGGRVAEQVIFDHLSTGASDDLSKATEIARSMVMRFGMIAELGHVSYDTEPQTFLGGAMPGMGRRNYSEETAREIDCAVRRIIEQSFVRARTIVDRCRPVVEEGAKLLLAQETLDEKDLALLFEKLEREPFSKRSLAMPARNSVPPPSLPPAN